MRTCAALVLALLLQACTASRPPADTGSAAGGTTEAATGATTESARFAALAKRAVDHQLQDSPIIAYFTGLPAPDHRRWSDRTPEGMAAFERGNDALLAELRTIAAARLEPRDVVTFDILREQLESEAQSRVCRNELWNVSHMNGWHMTLVAVAQEQPVTDADRRAQALERWRAVPTMVEQEIGNLRRGLAAGYSAPKSVVTRTIKQVNGLADAPADESPLASPAERSDDAAFKAAFTTVIAGQVNPALRAYARFLQDEYLPRAREALGVAANPDGEACYRASLRSYTTLNRSPQEVYDLGSRTVERNAAVVQDMGQRKFGTRDLKEIIRRVNGAADNQFASKEELIAYSREVVKRGQEKSAPMFGRMPSQTVLVEPFRDYMLGSGNSSHYELQVDDSKPAYYRIATDNWQEETRGGAEITAVHEAYPGHHMQLSFARTLEQSDVARLSFNSAYIEGWARYSEMLAEELSIYGADYALMSRRIWPARGMVADPGLHVLGWTREQTVRYLLDTGRFNDVEAVDLVDRMAILPGQLTAYDSGGLEIMALRQQAKDALGAAFDVREFHDVVLGQGVVPLGTLRRNVETWIAGRR